MRVTDMLALSVVPRWSIVPTTRAQSVADHAFRVAVIAYELHQRLPNFPHGFTFADLWYALWHDAAESRSGDISHLFKAQVAELDPGAAPGIIAQAELCMVPWVVDEPTPVSPLHRLVKLADIIEAYTFIRMYGDGPHSINVARRCAEQLREYIATHGYDAATVEALVDDIIAERER